MEEGKEGIKEGRKEWRNGGMEDGKAAGRDTFVNFPVALASLLNSFCHSKTEIGGGGRKETREIR
jgi:hypothetical protein